MLVLVLLYFYKLSHDEVVAQLEREVAELKEELARLSQEFAEIRRLLE